MKDLVVLSAPVNCNKGTGFKFTFRDLGYSALPKIIWLISTGHQESELLAGMYSVQILIWFQTGIANFTKPHYSILLMSLKSTSFQAFQIYLRLFGLFSRRCSHTPVTCEYTTIWSYSFKLLYNKLMEQWGLSSPVQGTIVISCWLDPATSCCENPGSDPFSHDMLLKLPDLHLNQLIKDFVILLGVWQKDMNAVVTVFAHLKISLAEMIKTSKTQLALEMKCTECDNWIQKCPMHCEILDD